MRAIFSVTFPFFALVLCGDAAVRRGMLPQLAIPGLNGFVLCFALPCMRFRFGAGTGRIARIILVSTCLSFFTFQAAVALMT